MFLCLPSLFVYRKFACSFYLLDAERSIKLKDCISKVLESDKRSLMLQGSNWMQAMQHLFFRNRTLRVESLMEHTYR
ncbi:hypothetical protein BVRB_2g038560 [Beta vulgaris subsp. vulgaris]|nr:hypothetical protein BVRB_2g038560 [Beta vulgaris subsp. vulgaris]